MFEITNSVKHKILPFNGKEDRIVSFSNREGKSALMIDMQETIKERILGTKRCELEAFIEIDKEHIKELERDIKEAEDDIKRASEDIEFWEKHDDKEMVESCKGCVQRQRNNLPKMHNEKEILQKEMKDYTERLSNISITEKDFDFDCYSDWSLFELGIPPVQIHLEDGRVILLNMEDEHDQLILLISE